MVGQDRAQVGFHLGALLLREVAAGPHVASDPAVGVEAELDGVLVGIQLDAGGAGDAGDHAGAGAAGGPDHARPR
jgi:hypothetical protein